MTTSKTTRFGQKVQGLDLNSGIFLPQKEHSTTLHGLFSQDYSVPLGRDDPCSAGKEADVDVAREAGMFDALTLI